MDKQEETRNNETKFMNTIDVGALRNQYNVLILRNLVNGLRDSVS